MRYALLLLAAPLLALDNGVTVYNASGSAQTNMAVSISRVFGRGEIPASYVCAQPYIAGVAATTWQCDKKSSWDDGSLKFVLFGVVIPSLGTDASVKVDFRPAASTGSGSGLTKAATIALTWDADMRFTYNTGTGTEITHTRDARTMMTALAESSCGLRKWRDGPVVTEWIVEDRCSGTLAYDFGSKWDTGTSAWIAAPDASYQSIHPFFIVSAYSNGAVKVQYIVENPWTRKWQNQVYQHRFRGGTALGTVVEQQTVDYTHPAGSRIRFDGWGNSSTVPDYFIDFNLPYLMHTGQVPSHATEVQTTGQTQATMSANHIQGQIDFMAVALGSYGGSPEKPQYCRTAVTACRNSVECCGMWSKATNVGGVFEDVAVIPGFYLNWLYAPGLSNASIAQRNQYWKEVFLGNALAAGNMPLHARESRNAATFCGNSGKFANCATTGLRAVGEFGRPVSIDAHDNESLEVGSYYPDGGPGYTLPLQIASGCANGQPCWQKYGMYGGSIGQNRWQAICDSNGVLHIYGLYFLPALFTGDFFYVEGLMLHAGFWSMTGDGTERVVPGNRQGSKGIYTNDSQFRYMAWRLRTVAQASFLSPSDWPEGEYFEKILKNNIAHLEGFLSMTTGEGANFYSTDPTSPYQFGYTITRKKSVEYGQHANDRPNFANPLRLLHTPSSTTLGAPPNVSMDQAYSMTKAWMDQYVSGSLDHSYKMGFTFVGSVLKYSAGTAVLSQKANPYAAMAYQSPGSKSGVRKLVTSLVQVSGATYRATVPSHGYTSTVFMCCADPAWTGNWASVERQNEGGARYTISNITLDTFDLTLPVTPTGNYPDCCSTANYQLAVSSSDSYTMEGGPPATAEEYAVMIYPTLRNRTGFSQGDAYWLSWLYATHGGYYKPNLQMFAMLLDQGVKTLHGLDIQDAYDWTLRNVYGMNREFGDGWMECPPGYSANPKFRAFGCSHPSQAWRVKPKIDNLVVTPGQTQVHFRFTAPTGDGAKIGIMAAPNGTEVFLDSRDSSDTAVTCVGRDCVATISSLTAGTQYRYRVTGGALGGTARTEGLVTTAASGGTANYALQFAPPAGLGIADVLVEHGATGSYGTTEAAAACATSCTVTLASIPANAVRYVRYTYRTAAAAAVAQGTMARMVQ